MMEEIYELIDALVCGSLGLLIIIGMVSATLRSINDPLNKSDLIRLKLTKQLKAKYPYMSDEDIDARVNTTLRTK